MEDKVRPTRYKELGYMQQGRSLWRLVDQESASVVGPQYKTKAELLGDLDRYAKDFGCEAL